MTETIAAASWKTIEALRDRFNAEVASQKSLAGASQAFAALLVERFPTVVLARVFAVTPMSMLPDPEVRVATAAARALSITETLTPATPVLALLGTAGVEASWNRRETSAGHRALPLVGTFVKSAPMVAALLSSLEVDLGAFVADPGVQIRAMTGNLNKRFFVPDARTATDGRGRNIIAAQDFVAKYGVRTVFGMGGGFVDKMLAVVVLFTREVLEATDVDRLASFIGTFKMATSKLVESGALFEGKL